MLLSHLIGTYFEEADRDDDCYVGYVPREDHVCTLVNDEGDLVLITYVQYCFDPDGEYPPTWNLYCPDDSYPELQVDNGGCDVDVTVYKKEAS